MGWSASEVPPEARRGGIAPTGRTTALARKPPPEAPVVQSECRARWDVPSEGVSRWEMRRGVVPETTHPRP